MNGAGKAAPQLVVNTPRVNPRAIGKAAATKLAPATQGEYSKTGATTRVNSVRSSAFNSASVWRRMISVGEFDEGQRPLTQSTIAGQN
jgi:hypothetical protein